jgi:hypothetical protein
MFASARLKIERANYHISDLERQFAAFVAEKPHRFSVQTHPNTGQLTIRVRFGKEVPTTYALIIGDAIHNLRASLDHAVWDIVGFDHGAQNRYLNFPTSNNGINFEASCNGIQTPSQWVKDAIKSTEAFIEGRGMDFYQLNALDNADKHSVITPVLRATSHPKLSIVRPDGVIAVRMEGNVLVGGTDEFANIATVPSGFSIELDDDAE